MSFKEQELVEVYNETPNSLVSKVVKVAVNQESVTANNNDSIILASIGNGNYWVVYDADINYWLLPKAKLRIDRYRYETVKLLFDCNDYEPEYDSFKLDKPAQVSILANNSEWKLEKRGVLKFINPLKTPEILEKDDEKNITISSVEDKNNPPPQSLAYTELLNIYNTNPKLLEKKAIKVLETTNSINRKRAGISQRIVLEKATKCNYWVVYDNTDKSCWLFFKNNMRISEYRYKDIQALFECYGYQPDYLSFKLVKPAKLISLATEEQKWIAEELGILEFI
ncbi:hypothetical protein [Synechocystis sp. PCC 7509]|uniref:hypothetical protein n=1 Tax=Synechocystis sp. PCC 7509 TaxID=927677 RepID=UPI0002ACEAB8|nr:hypothetical protein [Synechocystis sp. PCC 7509]